jgi:hypothetical protein
MPSINIQFHCLPEELAEFILKGVEAAAVNFVLIGGLPFSANLVSQAELEQTLIQASRAKSPLSIYILLAPPNLSALSRLKFYDLNPDNIVIDIGIFTDRGFKQSALSTKTVNPKTGELAKKIAQQLKKSTNAGVTAVNIESGAMSFTRSFRYTNKALVLEKEGIDMLPFAGGGKLVLGDITQKNAGK